MEENTQVQQNQSEGTDQSQQQTNQENTGDTTVAAPTTNEDGLPSEASERTKQRFESLTASNNTLAKELAEEKRRAKALEDAYKTLSHGKTSETQKQEQAPIYDEETGLFNEEVLNNYQARTEVAERNAQEAKQIAEGLRSDYQTRERERTEKIEAEEAYNAHPDLKPGSKEFNKELHDFTTAIILQERYLNGNELTFKEAGDRAKASISKIVGNAREEGARETQAQLEAKDFASVETTGSPNKAQQAETNLETLRRLSRTGSPKGEAAMLERISRFRQGK